MDHLEKLRAALASVDPSQLTQNDRLALLDLFERASVIDSSAA